MAESYIGVTEAGTPDAKLHSVSRTIGANTVEDEVVILGEPYLPTYFTGTSASSVATVNSHLVQIMAGASLAVKLRSIRVQQTGLATAAGLVQFALFRLSSAGTGGTVIVPSPLDESDAAAGATSMALPTSKGTESTQLIRGINLGVVDTAPIPTGAASAWEWHQSPHGKPIIIPAGASNGIALKVINEEAGATVAVNIEFTESSW